MYVKFRMLLSSLIVMTLLPAASVITQAQEGENPAVPVSLQGEIAYVLDGDVWLHDLATGKARQLTTDGNNQLPAWSPDGSQLLYSHGPTLEEADLYLLDVDGSLEPQKFRDDACCGSFWEYLDYRGQVFVDVGGDSPRLVADGDWLQFTEEVGIEGNSFAEGVPFDYGRGVYPYRNVRLWGPLAFLALE